MSETIETTTADTAATDATITTDATQAATSEADKAAGKDWQAEAEKWKAHARKHEDASKANADKAKRFDDFEESQKTEQEKLVAKATKAEDDAATSRGELAVMRAAVKHGLEEGDLDLLGTHGTPEEIDARAEKLSARIKASEADKPKPDFGGGDRGGDVTGKPQFETQIAEAIKAGNFAHAIALKEQRHAESKTKS